jgi:uncharacterized membrane protein YebE (DUF533 family)
MDTRGFLDQILQSGKEMADKGQDFVENKFGMPAEGEQRDAMVSGMKKGALGGGLLALLLGTGAGRRLGGSALKIGGLAALGGLAYKAYKDYTQKQGGEVTDKSLEDLAGPEADARSVQLIRAMISAAKADGHIDAGERENIKRQIDELDLESDFADLLRFEIDKPVDVRAIARGADSPASAAETYLASLMVIDVDNDAERQYLRDLATALGLSDDYASQLEAAALS